jgi:hypothetical protein
MSRFWYFEDALISRVASQKAEVRCGQRGLLLVHFPRVRVGVLFIGFFDYVDISFLDSSSLHLQIDLNLLHATIAASY